MTCACDRPFTEESLMCPSCEQAWVDGLIAVDADRLPDDWEEFAARQG